MLNFMQLNLLLDIYTDKFSFVVTFQLNQENTDDLERMQKSFCKIVLKEKYISYENALLKLNMESLQERRTNLSLKFAKSEAQDEAKGDH